MGERKRKLKDHQLILDRSGRCVYCASTKKPFTLEHMPPIGLFKDRQRPKGWEFASCARCNNGTRGVDAVAQLFAMIEPIYDSLWKIEKVSGLVSSVRQYAPRVLDEINRRSSHREVLLKENGILRPSVLLEADGCATKLHLDLFSEKFAMATFAQLLGRPIEMHGIIFSMWYLNQGMPLQIYHAYLSIMPSFDQLMQGKKVSYGQFSLNFNTESKGLIGAIVMLQNSLSIILFATDDKQYIEPLKSVLSTLVGPNRPTAQLTSPGLDKIKLL